MKERNVIGGVAATAMSGMMEFLSPLKWFMLLAVILIICDLRFGIRAAQYRKEKIRTSRAVRRSVNKVIDYICWILLAGGMGKAFGIPLDIPIIPAAVLVVIYFVEINSCFNNYFESIGKKIKIDVFKLLSKGKNMIEVELIEKKENEKSK